VISFYALAAGFLTGKYRNTADAVKSARGANVVKKYVNPRGLKILQALDTVARRRNTRPGVVAVAWLLTRQGVTSPIASATSLDQLADLVAATRLQLDPAEIEALGEASQETS
jgi:aryl-alcohol dehydrogenase-like predicted oxidoreductase